MEICQPRDLWCAADGEQMYFEHPPGIEVEATQSVANVRAFYVYQIFAKLYACNDFIENSQ